MAFRRKTTDLTIIVCGDRHWDDEAMIRDVLERIIGKEHIKLVVDGAAKGADSLAHKVAKAMGLATHRVRAEWQKYGAAAGPIRNRRMLNEQSPDLVIAFHDDLSSSKGTKDMLKAASKAHVETKLFSHKRTG